jgi:peptidoglycan hydrolase-like protein with peptidoglycan-binding domain
MNNKRSALTAAVLLSAAMGVVPNPVWSQGVPSDKPTDKKSAPTDLNRTPTQAGEDSNLPPRSESVGSSAMSTQDIMRVEEALQAKGHNPGTVDGVMDDKTKDAIRAFQGANGISMTGTVDEKTAQKLGVGVGKKSSPGSAGSDSGSRSSGSMDKSTNK